MESRDSGEVFLVERVHVFQPFSAGKAGIGEIDIEFRVQNDRFFKNASVWHLNAGHVQYGDRFSLASCLDRLNTEVSDARMIFAMPISGTTSSVFPAIACWCTLQAVSA